MMQHIKIEWNVQIPMLVLIKRVKTKYLLLEQKKFQNKSKNICEVYQSESFRCIMSLSYRVTFLCNVLEQTHYTSESPVRYFFMKKLQSGVKINDLCIGAENIFISPRLFFQDGRVPRRIFCEERIAIAFVIPGKPLSKKKIQY